MRSGAAVLYSLVATICLLLGGCYDVTQEVIPLDQGEVLPYTSNYATLDKGGSLSLSRSGSGNDYRFQSTDKDGAKRTGSFRVMRIKGDVFAVQLRYDDEHDYSIFFENITSNRFTGMAPAPGSDTAGLAKSYGVTLDEDPLDDSTWDLGGSPSAMLGFIKAHSGFDFTASSGD
jgi:hypothetical protein